MGRHCGAGVIGGHYGDAPRVGRVARGATRQGVRQILSRRIGAQSVRDDGGGGSVCRCAGRQDRQEHA